MKQFIKRVKQISILFLVLSFVGCEDDDAVLPSVEANFTYTVNVDTGTVSFLNISENGNTYEWDFGDSTSSTEINPTKTYANGTYTVILKAKNASGASDIFESVIVILIPEILAFPITFDNENVNYGVAPFNGVAFNIVDNPAPGGSNNVASKVGEIVNSGATFEGIAIGLGDDLDLSTQKSVKVNFWSSVAVNVLLKLEITENDAAEKTVSHSGSGWEELIFSFDSSKTYPKIVVFVDAPGTTSGTFYVDDFFQIDSPAPLCIAETSENIDPANGDINWTFQTKDIAHTFEAFGNTSGEIVDNPLSEGINTSCNVEKFTKTGGCETFAGLGSELATALDFTQSSTNKLFKMKVLAETQVTDVTLRLERLPFPDTDPAVDRVATITQVGEWQELTFDFTDVNTGTYKSMIIYFERNANCDGDVYYFDDIVQVAGTGGSGGGGGSFDSGLLINGDFENGSTAWSGNAVDVRTEGDNAFNFANVMSAGNAFDVNLSQVVEINEGATYTLTFDASSDGNRTILAGIGLNGAPFHNDVKEVNLTATTQTFTLEVTATDTATGIDFGGTNSRVIFDMGAATGVVVIDNVSLFSNTGGGGTGDNADEFTSNGDFETGTTSGYTIFDGNGGVFTVTNEEANGGSFSGKLTSSAGKEVVVKQANIGIGTVTPNTEVTITFDLKGSLAGDGGVVFVEFFSELATEGVSKAEILSGGPLVPTNNWQSYSYTTTTGSDVSGGVTVQLKTACGAVNGCNVVAYFDNVSVKFKN